VSRVPRRVLEVNLVAPFLLAQAFGRKMLAAGQGSIINIASVAGLLGIADRAAYNASKHGLIGLTRTLAAEWGGRGVRVNAVCPGWVKTEMDVADQAGGGYTDADITGRVPMGRFASPDDIARAVAFLADDEASGFINGHALAVDGGCIGDGSWESLRLPSLTIRFASNHSEAVLPGTFPPVPGNSVIGAIGDYDQRKIFPDRLRGCFRFGFIQPFLKNQCASACRPAAGCCVAGFFRGRAG